MSLRVEEEIKTQPYKFTVTNLIYYGDFSLSKRQY